MGGKERMDGWMDGWMERKLIVVCPLIIPNHSIIPVKSRDKPCF
jgi:hypothetical protein